VQSPLRNMHNPPHPGEFFKEVYLSPFNISSRTVAEKLLVSPSTFNRLVNAESNISPEMALRLSKTLGRCLLSDGLLSGLGWCSLSILTHVI